MPSITKVIALVTMVVVALLTLSACGSSTHHNTRQGCKAAVVKALTSNSTAEPQQCKGLSKEVRQSIAIDILEGR